MTQWSYCSGGGGGLPVEKPEITAEISRRRVERAAELEVDTLRQRLPVVRAPAVEAGEEAASTCSTSSSSSRSAGIEVGGHARGPESSGVAR